MGAGGGGGGGGGGGPMTTWPEVPVRQTRRSHSEGPSEASRARRIRCIL